VRFPLPMMAALAGYILRNKLRPPREWQRDRSDSGGNPFWNPRGESNGHAPHPLIGKRFPLVLMLEPLHACNLTCASCGRIREYQGTITAKLTGEQCLRAVEECGAPVVSICGGEPLLDPDLPRVVEGTLARGRYIYLCTNGTLLRKHLADYRPHRRLFLNVHLDGLEQTHDREVGRSGVFREALEAMRAAKAAGFRVSTNTTVYRETDMREVEALFEYLEPLRLDGHMLSPGYGYSAVNEQELFLTREDITEKFREAERLAARFKLSATPAYLEFLRGERELPCTAWGNPTYNVRGWRSPCYLIAEAHYASFVELMTRTPWTSYGAGRDPRCEHCMVHCGYEPSAALGVSARRGDAWKLLRWAIR